MRPWIRRNVGTVLVAAAVAAAATGGVLIPVVVSNGGTTRLVSTSGTDSGNCASSPCLTLNYAYAQAAGGDTIRMAAGSYGNQTINYRAAIGRAVTIKPADGANVTVQDATIKASYVSIEGPLTFRTLDIGDGASTPQRITNVSVTDFTVDHNDSTSPTRIAMRAWASDNVTLARGSIGDTLAGASVGQESNLIQFSGQPLSYNAGWTIDGVRFHDNDTASGSAAHNECVYAIAVVGLTIANSDFQSCTYYAIFFTDFLNGAPALSDVTVRDSQFHTGRNASFANYGFAIDFNDNVAPNNFKLLRNTIENAVALGYAGPLTNGFEVRGNIIGQGVYTRFDGSFACKTGVTFAYNVMPNACGANTTTATEAAIRAGWANASTTWGTVDDFHLLPGGPAVGKGAPVDAESLDFGLVERGSPPNAGALETLGAAPTPTPTNTPTTTPTATPTATPTSTPPPDGQANAWVNTTAGGSPSTCTPACPFDASHAYASFDAALDAVPSGATIRVVAGTYGNQSLSGDKTSMTSIIAADGTTIGTLSMGANFVTVENVTSDSGTGHSAGIGLSSDHIVLRNVKAHGDYTAVQISGGDDITWDGGELGQSGDTGGQRDFCTGGDAEPLIIQNATNVLVKHLSFWPWAVVSNANCNHFETVRIDGTGAAANSTSNINLIANRFEPGGTDNTARVFITRPSTAPTSNPTNITLANNYFGGHANAYDTDVHANVTTCATFVFAYNTFRSGDHAIQCATTAGMQWIGNLGPKAGNGCFGTYVKNVWQGAFTRTCGSDTWVTGPDYSITNLGIASDGSLNAGSVAIDKAETPSASDYCTGTLGSIDGIGTVRPQGSICDAGWRERP